MQIIIDLPDKRYIDIQRIASVQADRCHFQTAEQIIAKGTPISSAATIINIEQIKNELRNYMDDYESNNLHDEAAALALALKIIDIHTAGSRITNNE